MKVLIHRIANIGPESYNGTDVALDTTVCNKVAAGILKKQPGFYELVLSKGLLIIVFLQFSG